MAKQGRLVINAVTVKQTGHIEVQWADEVFDSEIVESQVVETVTHSKYDRRVFDSWADTPAVVRQWVSAIVQGT